MDSRKEGLTVNLFFKCSKHWSNTINISTNLYEKGFNSFQYIEKPLQNEPRNKPK